MQAISQINASENGGLGNWSNKMAIIVHINDGLGTAEKIDQALIG